MRKSKLALALGVSGLLLLAAAGFLLLRAPASRAMMQAKLIRASLPTGADEKQVIGFLASQDADMYTDSRSGRREIAGEFPLVAPSAWGRFTRWGVPFQWLENFHLGVRFRFEFDARGRMTGFETFPPKAQDLRALSQR